MWQAIVGFGTCICSMGHFRMGHEVDFCFDCGKN